MVCGRCVNGVFYQTNIHVFQLNDWFIANKLRLNVKKEAQLSQTDAWRVTSVKFATQLY